MKKTGQEWNQGSKAWEPALHTRTRLGEYKDKVGKYEDPRRVDSVGEELNVERPPCEL